MPTSVINLAAGFVIRPFLTYLTDCWNERRFQDFKKKLLTIMAVIGGLHGAGCGRDRSTWQTGAGASGMGSWRVLQRKADGALAGLHYDRAGRRLLCGTESLLLRSGHFTETEADSSAFTWC